MKDDLTLRVIRFDPLWGESHMKWIVYFDLNIFRHPEARDIIRHWCRHNGITGFKISVGNHMKFRNESDAMACVLAFS